MKNSTEYTGNVAIWVRMTLSVKIELIQFSVLSTRDPNYKNDIQLFLQLFDELKVNGDYH